MIFLTRLNVRARIDSLRGVYVLRQLLICAGLLGLPGVPNLAQQPQQPQQPHQQSVHKDDPRLPLLQAFFRDANSPLHALAVDFLEAADHNGLDWRLLPSISMVETGCGRTAVGKNLFGWDSGRKQFASFRDAIQWVASRLGNSKLYRGKDLVQILATYNARPKYAGLVRSVMKQLGPSAQAKPRLATEAGLSQVSLSPDITRPEPIQ